MNWRQLANYRTVAAVGVGLVVVSLFAEMAAILLVGVVLILIGYANQQKWPNRTGRQ